MGDASNQLRIQELLSTPLVTVLDVECSGTCAGESAEERVEETQLVFPYRGVYVRHIRTPTGEGWIDEDDDSVAEANQVVFFNAGEVYRVSHPVTGGDASLVLIIDDEVLRELVPKEMVRSGRSGRSGGAVGAWASR